MKKTITGFQIVVLMAFIFYAQFYQLNKLPIRIWDEARLATNAYEIATHGHWLLPTVDGKPDMWNTKPPLMVWAQALFIKAGGLNELSVRLPSAICAAFTTLLIAFFILRITGSSWAALLGGIVLSTSVGYMGWHGTRFGEYDSMLAFFCTAYLFAFFMYTESAGSRRNKYLLLFFVLLTCAALTKGIAAMLFTPALFIYIVFRKRLKDTLSNRYLYLGIGLFLLFAGGYYFLREHYNPGYLAAVSENELGGRFSQVNEDHPGDWDFYLLQLKGTHFWTWYWALPTSLFFVLFLTNRKVKRASVFCMVSSFCFMTVIALSQTKIQWYDLPLYPLFACIIAILVWQMAGILSGFKYVNRQVALIVLIIAFSIRPVDNAFKFIKWQYDDLEKDNTYAVSYYFRDAIEGRRDLKNMLFLFDEYCPQWRIYVRKLQDMGTGVDDEMLYGGNRFKVGQKIIANRTPGQDFIERNYQYKILDEFYGVKYYELTGVK